MRVLGWSLLVVLLLVQVWGLYSPSPPTTGPAGADKLGHLLGFGAPAALAWWLGGRWWVAAMVGHALVSETVQQRISPERMTDWRDTVANLLGLALGVALAAAAARARRHHGGMPSGTQER